MKIDHQLAERWIKPNAKVLDLGCGNGDLLAHLQNKLRSEEHTSELQSR